jgi:ATP-dependent RNA helicase RhlE
MENHDPHQKPRRIRALVLVPTRELAAQVLESIKTYGAHLPLIAEMVVGGASINMQIRHLRHGCDIIVATTGRLCDHMNERNINLSSVEMLVLDEADRMLDMGFLPDIRRVIGNLPKQRQNLLFSATLSDDVNNINEILLHDPLTIKIEAEENTIDLISQLGYFVSPERKGPLLRYLIKHNGMQQVLVFTSSVFQADLVADKLRINDIKAAAIHSKKSQGAREEALNKFKSGKLRVLVATDLMARGIDIKFLPHVINYELPRSPKDYIHRIGRTGRAESPGEAISLICPEDQHHFKIIQKKMGKWVTMIDSKDLDLKGY